MIIMLNGKYIKGEIYKKGYNIKDIALILNINPMTISNWVNNRNIQNIEKFIKLINLLEIDPKKLIK